MSTNALACYGRLHAACRPPRRRQFQGLAITSTHSRCGPVSPNHRLHQFRKKEGYARKPLTSDATYTLLTVKKSRNNMQIFIVNILAGEEEILFIRHKPSEVTVPDKLTKEDISELVNKTNKLIKNLTRMIPDSTQT
jgi:hypothetical protein